MSDNDDRFLTSVAAVWPEHTLTLAGQLKNGKYNVTLYTCDDCGAIYWPDLGVEEVYPDRYVPNFDGMISRIEYCECWDKINRRIPIIEEPIKGLQRIRDDLEGEDG